MSISDLASLIGGAALGGPFSEFFKRLIEEAKKVKDFKPVSEDLASTMERLVPIFNEIDSMQQGTNYPGSGELKVLMETIERAVKMVRKCSSVQWYSIGKKAYYTRKIRAINQDLLRFCQTELQLIQYRNQLKSMQMLATLVTNLLLNENEFANILKRYNGLLSHAMNPSCSICDGCNSMIEHASPVNVLHPECFCCDVCHKPIANHELEDNVSNSGGRFHKSCYGLNCYVCEEKIPLTAEGIIKYNEHPFWKEKYCPSHEDDGTAKCCSCERLEPRGTNYVMLGDYRWLCLECMESSVMDTYECHSLHLEIRDFFEGLFFKVEKEFPLLLVEQQALNKAEEKEKIDSRHAAVTRGLCLSEEHTVTSIKSRLRMGPDNQLIEMVTETQTVSGSEVTGILIIYGLPRLLTGSILAREMMHAWLRLNGHGNLNKVLKEGICQVVGLMWLQSQIYATTDAYDTSDPSKNGECPVFERKLMWFCKNQIEGDESPLYRDGLRQVHQMFVSNQYNLKDTLKHIISVSSFF
ncbi:Protein DA1-related 3 [Cardamine amara subsp. amara]|uniref:Protein DA1-related 3 n=1 Tax=Cardamine amara subsp. amara TaxID=228776 RepID=A0ABD1APJ0_CARAN